MQIIIFIICFLAMVLGGFWAFERAGKGESAALPWTIVGIALVGIFILVK